jgi:hypothetical protein
MNLMQKIRRNGVIGSMKKASLIFQRKSGILEYRFKNIAKYANPTEEELEIIERQLIEFGVPVESLAPPLMEFQEFIDQDFFPQDYHGGPNGMVWKEKLLEHWISSKLLGVLDYAGDDVFVDIAAANSPWVFALREQIGLSAHAIDLEASDAYRHLPYYRVEDATSTQFSKGTVKGIALHCAYEMFMADDDHKLITEMARILQPGGKAIILPLYLHTHYCSYSTPEYFGKGYSDPNAREYVRMDSLGLPSSRKYDPVQLKARVLDPIIRSGMQYRLLILRNKSLFGREIYCHFILEISR